MLKLTIIIVNYNVKYFLEQCLHSVEKALKEIDAEIFVVDNNSVDSSCEMVREKFSYVHLIENNENVGFSKANNQAVQQAKGKYVLLLNPDTVVQEDTFKKCIDFMDDHPEAGGLGVKMIDGKGNFLPESKRSMPTPAVAFCKIFGISRLFPRSKIFGKYHLGYLDQDQTNQVEILPGAFMMIRKEALAQTGYLDETFFMYGEDIDLSYRLIKAGYKNYYFPETTIIHYKGESTKKDTINYVLVFYKAMIIFAQKHFSTRRAKLFSMLINFAIYFRASISIGKRLYRNLILPFLDIALVCTGYYFVTPLWGKYVTHQHYPDTFYFIVIPVYIVIWTLGIYSLGGYEKPTRLFNGVKGIFWGTIVILAAYALLPKSWQFSRALILIGMLLYALAYLFTRITLHALKVPYFRLASNTKKRVAIVGLEDEALRVQRIMEETGVKINVIGFIDPRQREQNKHYLGNLNQIQEIVKINKIDEVIFCAKEITSQQIITMMMQMSQVSVDFKIAPPESLSIIGSNSIHTSGELYAIHVNSIHKPKNIRKKRFFDVISSLLLLLLSPVIVMIQKRPAGYFLNVYRVFSGKYTWIGYYNHEANLSAHLPQIKPGILNPFYRNYNKTLSSDLKQNLNLLYAKDYKFMNDLLTLIRNFRSLGDRSE